MRLVTCRAGPGVHVLAKAQPGHSTCLLTPELRRCRLRLRILAVASHYVAAVGARSGFSGGAGGSDTSAFDVGNVAWSRLGGYVAGNGSIHTAAMALELSNQQESSFQPVLLDPAMLEETGRQLQALKEARNAASKLKKHPSMRTARKQQARSPRQQESLSFQVKCGAPLHFARSNPTGQLSANFPGSLPVAFHRSGRGGRETHAQCRAHAGIHAEAVDGRVGEF